MKYDKQNFFIELGTSAEEWEKDLQQLMEAKLNFIVSGFAEHHEKIHAELLEKFKYAFGRNDDDVLTFFHPKTTAGQTELNKPERGV